MPATPAKELEHDDDDKRQRNKMQEATMSHRGQVCKLSLVMGTVCLGLVLPLGLEVGRAEDVPQVFCGWIPMFSPSESTQFWSALCTT